MPAATTPSPSPDIRSTLDRFLLATYRGCQAAAHERAVTLEELQQELGLPERLTVKLAAFLEGEGLVDYDDRAVDITVDGMLRAEEILRDGSPSK